MKQCCSICRYMCYLDIQNTRQNMSFELYNNKCILFTQSKNIYSVGINNNQENYELIQSKTLTDAVKQVQLQLWIFLDQYLCVTQISVWTGCQLNGIHRIQCFIDSEQLRTVHKVVCIGYTSNINGLNIFVWIISRLVHQFV